MVVHQHPITVNEWRLRLSTTVMGGYIVRRRTKVSLAAVDSNLVERRGNNRRTNVGRLSITIGNTYFLDTTAIWLESTDHGIVSCVPFPWSVGC